MNRQRLKCIVENVTEMVMGDIKKCIREEISRKQMSNAAHRRVSDPKSVQIRRTSDGELSTVKMNNRRGQKTALSRIVIKIYNKGQFEKCRVINNTQDKLIRKYNEIIKSAQRKGFIKQKTSDDRVINKTVTLLINPRKAIIWCIYIETDDLNVVTHDFDINNARRIINKLGIDEEPFKFPDEALDKPKVKRTRISNMRDNWEWITQGNPRPWKRFDNQ